MHTIDPNDLSNPDWLKQQIVEESDFWSQITAAQGNADKVKEICETHPYNREVDERTKAAS